MTSTLSICNTALAQIGADSIASLDEESVAARECARVFDAAVGDLLERSEWGFKLRRIAAAEIANPRPDEWDHAYVRPADAAQVLGIVLPGVDADTAAMFGPVPFVEADGIIFTDVPDAQFEYAAASVPVSAFPPLFRHALELEVAARVAYPIKRDRTVRADMVQLAELALARAIADDQNRSPRRTPDWLDLVGLVRAGLVRER